MLIRWQTQIDFLLEGAGFSLNSFCGAAGFPFITTPIQSKHKLPVEAPFIPNTLLNFEDELLFVFDLGQGKAIGDFEGPVQLSLKLLPKLRENLDRNGLFVLSSVFLPTGEYCFVEKLQDYLLITQTHVRPRSYQYLRFLINIRQKGYRWCGLSVQVYKIWVQYGVGE